MKKYVIRSIGWIFDDDWYNNEGEYFTEGIYENLEEATARLRYLNYLRFLNQYSIFKFEPIVKNYKEGSDFYEKIQSFFMDKLHINPTVFLEDYQFPEKKHYPYQPTETQIEQLLKLTGISFYTLAGFEEEQISLLVPKKNIELFKGTPFEKFEDEYFFDEGDNIRAFSTKKAAYELGIKDSNLGLGYIIQYKLLSGSLEVLSEAPNLLAGLIGISKNLSYEDEVLHINPNVTAEELLQLDSLLKTPILTFEEKSIDELPTVKWTAQALANVARKEWENIPEISDSEILSSIQIHKLKTSDTYLNQCAYGLGNKGLKIIFEHLKMRLKYPDELSMDNYRSLRYKGKLFNFHGVITKMEKVNNEFLVHSSFKINYQNSWDNNKLAKGEGKSLKSAFWDSLINWLEKYSSSFVKEMGG